LSPALPVYVDDDGFVASVQDDTDSESRACPLSSSPNCWRGRS
jgi:hypothetical protein